MRDSYLEHIKTKQSLFNLLLNIPQLKPLIIGLFKYHVNFQNIVGLFSFYDDKISPKIPVLKIVNHATYKSSFQ